jgi:serine/threonine protein phosphatase 1
VQEQPLGRIPAGRRIYAIGDIHGRDDLLGELHQRILSDAEDAGHLAMTVIYLGDYIDRGPGSRRVIDMLLRGPPPGLAAIHLLGNHEAMLLDFLKDPAGGQMWLFNGGDATLESYEVDSSVGRGRSAFGRLQAAARAALPPGHLAFLRALELTHRDGDYFFCHAGVRPDVALDAQDAHDLVWIRDEFLECDAALDKIVVHGHSISDEVDFRPYRIGVDTGAWFSGHLSALVLEGDQRRVIETGVR